MENVRKLYPHFLTKRNFVQPPKSDICVICGLNKATTKDHIPPKGLFKGLNSQLITVPACLTCNAGTSSEDEDFRFYISMQIGKQTPGSARLWDDGAYKSIIRKTSLRHAVIKTAHEVTILDKSGAKLDG